MFPKLLSALNPSTERLNIVLLMSDNAPAEVRFMIDLLFGLAFRRRGVSQLGLVFDVPPSQRALARLETVSH